MSFLQRARKIKGRYRNPVMTQLGGFRMMMKVMPLYLMNKEEKTPKVPVGPFRTDALLYAEPPASGLRVTWFGHSGMLLEIDGVRVLIDPVWDERASPAQWFGPRRFFAPTIALKELPPVDVVLLSHDHYDHLGKGTIRALAELETQRGARWVTSLGVGRILTKFGVAAERITELDWTEMVTAGNLSITALPARHFSGRGLLNRNQTLWSSFVLRGSRHNVYFGADSGWWEGFAEIGAAKGPFDLTMLEVGAYHPLWGDIHLGPDHALEAFAALGGTGLLMPIHWGLFDLALHGWRQPMTRVVELARDTGVRLWSPVPGVPTEVVEGVETVSGWWRS